MASPAKLETETSALAKLADQMLEPEVLGPFVLHLPNLITAYFLVIFRNDKLEKIDLHYSLINLTGFKLPKEEQENVRFLATILGDNFQTVLTLLSDTAATRQPNQDVTQLTISSYDHENGNLESLDARIFAYPILSHSNPEEALVLVRLSQDPEFFKQRQLLVKAEKEQRTLEKLLKRLHEAMPSLAHQIKQPLSGLNLILDYILLRLKDPVNFDPSDIRSKATLGKTSIHRLSHLVDKLLHGDSFVTTLSLLDCFQDAKKSLISQQTEFENSGGIFSVSIPESLPECTADEVVLTDSIAILLENAFKYADPQHGAVSVSIFFDVSTNRINVKVDNNGQLIPSDQLESIFDFGKRSTTEELGKRKKQQTGHGIGLSLLRKNLEELPNGQVVVSVDPRKKLNTFILSFDVIKGNN